MGITYDGTWSKSISAIIKTNLTLFCLYKLVRFILVPSRPSDFHSDTEIHFSELSQVLWQAWHWQSETRLSYFLRHPVNTPDPEHTNRVVKHEKKRTGPQTELSMTSNLTACLGDKGFSFSMAGWVDNKNKKPYLYVTYLRGKYKIVYERDSKKKKRQCRPRTGDQWGLNFWTAQPSISIMYALCNAVIYKPPPKN